MTDSNIRVLLVEDDDDDALIVRELLADAEGERHAVDWVRGVDEAMPAILSGRHDVALVDYRLGARDGLSLLGEAAALRCPIPLILLTGRGDVRLDDAAMDAGAADYLDKGRLDSDRLARSIRHAIRQKRVDTARRDAEQFALSALDSLSAHVAVLDDSGRIVAVNRAWREYTVANGGDPATCCEGANYLRVCDAARGRWAADAHAMARAIRDVLAGRSESFSHEYPCHGPGHRRWFLGRVTRFAGPGAPRAVVSHEDVTERRLADEALRNSERRFRAVFDQTFQFTGLLDPLGTMLETNRTSLESRGIAREEAIGLPFWETPWWPDDPEARARVREAVDRAARGEFVRFEAEYVRAGGERGVVDFSLKPARDESGRVVLLIPEGRDITEQVRAAAEVRRLNEHLARRLRRIESLRRIDESIASGDGRARTLALVAEEAVGQLAVAAAAVLLYDAASGTLEYAADAGFSSTMAGRAGPSTDASLAGRAALSGCVQHAADLARCPVPDARAPLFAAEGLVSCHAIPIQAKGRVAGVLELYARSDLVPDAEWFAFADSLAGQAAIALDNASMLQGLRAAHAELAAAYDATIDGWARALDLRDKETEGHSRRVTEMTVRVARAMGVAEADLVHARRGALLHDIGKMAIPDAILHKPGPLSEPEWEVMRRHPALAVEMLRPIEFLGPALEIPFCHHEKWDGSGYPRGLRGEAIPLSARIFAAVDIWDALSNDRPYRPAWPQDRVREHLAGLSGSHLDPEVVRVFLGLLEAGPGGDPGPAWAGPGPLEGPAPGPSGAHGRRPATPDRPTRALVVDDDPGSAHQLGRLLGTMGFEVALASDGDEAWRRIGCEDFRLVVADWMMPGLEGPSLCRRIRGRPARHYTYVLLITARDRAEDRLAGLASGADDFLSKPIDPDELSARLAIARRLLAVQDELLGRAAEAERVQGELRRQNERLVELMAQDPLTGLSNRRHLMEILDARLAMAAGRGEPLSVIMLDVDHFKPYNDSFGHPAGDEVLRRVASILRSQLRGQDLVARYGGEEFVALLPGSDASAARATAERLRAAVACGPWPLRPVTASFGVATLTGGAVHGPDLLEQADLALYRSKRSGRDRVTHALDLEARVAAPRGPARSRRARRVAGRR